MGVFKSKIVCFFLITLIPNYYAYSTNNRNKSAQDIYKDEDFLKWKKYDGYKIDKIIIYQKDAFAKVSNKPLNKFINILNNINPSIKQKTIKNHLLIKENSFFSAFKMYISKNNINKLSYIKKAEFKMVADEKLQSLKIIIEIKKKFTIIINPFSYYLGAYNILRSPSEIYITFFPQYSSFSDYEINLRALNIENTNTDFLFDYRKFYIDSHYNINILNRFRKNIDIGYQFKFKSGFRDIKFFEDDSLKSSKQFYRYDYNYIDIWCGYNLLNNKNFIDFNQKLILTGGYNNLFYSKKVPIEIFKINKMNNFKSFGLGLCFLKRDNKILNDTYGYDNDEIINEGYKYHFFFGYLKKEKQDYDCFLGINLSKGYFFSKLGYLFFNLQHIFSLKEKSLSNTLLNNQFGYVTKKIDVFNKFKIRQLYTLEYIYRKKNLQRNVLSMNGLKYFTYFFQYFADISERFKFCFENILYNPLKIVLVRFNPILFIEYFYIKSDNHKILELIKKNHFTIGGGLIFNIFGINLRFNIGYSPSNNYSNIGKLKILIGSCFSLDCANLNINSPTYKELEMV